MLKEGNFVSGRLNLGILCQGDITQAKNLAEMGTISFFNCAVKIILCVIDVFTEYALVKPLTDEKRKIIFHSFG